MDWKGSTSITMNQNRTNFINMFSMKSYLRLVFLLLLLLTAAGIHAQTGINPVSFTFQPQQTLTESDEQIFMIKNMGDVPLLVHPEDVVLQGKQAQTTHLSVLSYNIENDDGDWSGRFAFMLEEIRNMEVDVIGLQEVLQHENLDNQAMQMADSLGFYYYFDSVDDEDQVHRFGNAIVSRYPIEETNFRALKPLSYYRNAIHARINVNGHTVDMYNTHLHHTPIDHHIREEQIDDLLDFIEETSNEEFIFVTGDFNANPDWDEMQQMYETLQDVYPLFHENHLGPEHATLNHRLGHQMRRIDYVFFNKASIDHLVPLSAEIVMDQEHEDPEMENDHFGVFATFDLLADDVDFVLNTFEESVELQPQDSVATEVIFAPQTTGNKEVVLTVQDDDDMSRLLPLRNFKEDEDTDYANDAIISGEGFDATIFNFPWYEDFEGTGVDSLPFGWSTNTADWGVKNSAYAGGNPPELVFAGESDLEGTFYAMSPPLQTTGLDSMLVNFRHFAENDDNPEMYSMRLVTIADDQEYLVAEWTDPEDIMPGEQSFRINSEEHGVDADRLYLAWVFEGVSDHIDKWAIDNIALHALPALSASPGEYDFGLQQIDTGSDSLTIVLENIGGGVVSIHPEDIEITGDGADHYVLHSIAGNVELESGESTDIYLVFAPQSVGEHSVSLTIHEKTVDITGECFDPTITELPWEEDFSALVQGGVPLGWESDTRNWEAFNLNNAGGEPPEMVFWWQPEKTGRFYLITPEIVTEGMDTLAFSFKYRVQNFQEPGQYTLSVITIADGNEHVIHEWVDPGDIEPSELFAVVDTPEHGVGSDSFRLAWVFDGITNNIVSWDFDDIHLSEPGDSPIPGADTDSIDFGQQPINTTSEPKAITIQNRGGGTWILEEDNLQLTGPDAASFEVEGFDGMLELGLFETAEITITFSPAETGPMEAELLIDGMGVNLSGWGMDDVDYFIYSDFTIVENGTAYTNVGGFREIPGFVPAGSLNAVDISGEGEFGGVVLELEYDLEHTDTYTLYYMWAYPPVDLSDYSHIVVYLKADTEVSDIKLRLQDVEGYEGVDGESFAYMDAGTEWQRFKMPVAEMELASWADNHPDMQEIQKIDILFEKDVVYPQSAKIYLDLVGFTDEPTDVPTVQNRNETFSMYPNPATATVTIWSAPGSAIVLYDINGKPLQRENAKTGVANVDISALHPGVYIVHVIKHSEIQVQKLLVY